MMPALTGAVGGASGGGALFYDTFTDTYDTLLTAHTPDTGGPWEILSGNVDPYRIGSLTGPVNNVGAKRLSGSYAVNYEPAVVDVGVSDVRLTCDIYYARSVQFQGLAFRGGVGATPVFWFVQIDNSALKLYYWTGTGFSLKDTFLHNPAPAATHLMVIEAAGSSIKCWFDTVLVFDIVDALGQLNTKHGIFQYLNNNIGYWDNLLIEAI